jgi:hypothetical protein
MAAIRFVMNYYLYLEKFVSTIHCVSQHNSKDGIQVHKTVANQWLGNFIWLKQEEPK